MKTCIWEATWSLDFIHAAKVIKINKSPSFFSFFRSEHRGNDTARHTHGSNAGKSTPFFNLIRSCPSYTSRRNCLPKYKDYIGTPFHR